MLLEIDEVAVDLEEWIKVLRGDDDARQRLREKLKGVVLYMHNFSQEDNEIIVTLRELDRWNVLNDVEIKR